jgi:MFS family permease
MNAVYAASSYPAGHLSDRADRRLILGGGIALIAADIALATTHGIAGLITGISFWGLHMGFSKGLFTALLADSAPAERRGTAFGLFNLVSGVVLLLASLVAGALWDQLGPAATFYAGASFAVLGVVGLIPQVPIPSKTSRSATNP